MSNRLKNIFLDSVAALDPEKLVFDALEPRADRSGYASPMFRFDVKTSRPIWIVAVGKSARKMALGATRKLEGQIAGGIVVLPSALKDADCDELKKNGVEVYFGAHPIPDESSVVAGNALLDFAANLPAGDCVLFLLSGGASSIVCVPNEGIALSQKQEITKQLLGQAVPIEQLNRERTRYSKIKGGGLARAFKASVNVFVVSDVVGNDVSVIGSGLMNQPGVRHCVLADVNRLAKVAKSFAEREFGDEVVLAPAPATGEVRDLAMQYARVVEAAQVHHRKQLWIGYGEPVVAMDHYPDSKRGSGGRNHLLALEFARCAQQLGLSATAVFAASDGCDGSSQVAGVEMTTTDLDGLVARGFCFERDALSSARWWEELGKTVVIPPGTPGAENNLLDLHLILTP